MNTERTPEASVAAISERPPPPSPSERMRRLKTHVLWLGVEGVSLALAVTLLTGGERADLAGTLLLGALPLFAVGGYVLHAALATLFASLAPRTSLIAVHAGTLVPLSLCVAMCGVLL